ncbi:hypothetical protein CEQ90_10885 [Lewinellaceae bacterium SD302]|nr:hypothetical protein CEQ90_10885 [Lewinellaceae bacterium SD302]
MVTPEKPWQLLRRLLPSIPKEGRWELTVCIGIAFIFWLVINLTTEEHTIKKPVRVSYVVSEDEVLLSAPTSDAEATISGPGWELLWSNFFQPVIDVSIYRNRADSKVITQVDLSAVVSESLYSSETELDKLMFFPVTLETETKASKIIPIVVNTQVDYAEGFQGKTSFTTVPDSVEVWGPVSKLDSLTYWPTDTLRLKNVASNINQEIGLSRGTETIAPILSKVKVQQQVEVFTEKELFVPVQVINPPARDSFSIFPRQVRLKVGVLQSNYDQIRPDSFRLTADLNGMRTEDGRNSIPLTLEKRPRSAISVTFNPRVAEYFFFKKE